MTKPIIFRAEEQAGLADAIKRSSSVAYASRILLTAGSAAASRNLDVLKNLPSDRARGSRNDFDLHYIDTVLASTGWNGNDDFFDKLETWIARRTPVDKQLNYEHDAAKIVGHIVSSRVMGEDGKALADDSVIDDLPAHFHVVTGAVVYKRWPTPELQQRVDDLLAEIATGQWFVSMECLFSGFDYALKDKQGSVRIVARNSQTAFMTKHLRAYGGSGQFGADKIGRVLRNITFSGKGFVRQPANPESVILDSPVSAPRSSTSASVQGCALEDDYDYGKAEQGIHDFFGVTSAKRYTAQGSVPHQEKDMSTTILQDSCGAKVEMESEMFVSLFRTAFPTKNNLNEDLVRVEINALARAASKRGDEQLAESLTAFKTAAKGLIRVRKRSEDDQRLTAATIASWWAGDGITDERCPPMTQLQREVAAYMAAYMAPSSAHRT